jgi:hypothetical protein
LRIEEQRRGRPFSESARNLFLAIEFGPQSIEAWLAARAMGWRSRRD